MTLGPLDDWNGTATAHRDWVRSWIAQPQQAEQFDRNWKTKLEMVWTLGSRLELDDTRGWQALGVVFGDALSAATGYPWAELTDEHGTSPCLVIDADSESVLFPLTMLSKRAEEGERPDKQMVIDLFNFTVDHAEQVEQKLSGKG